MNFESFNQDPLSEEESEKKLESTLGSKINNAVKIGLLGASLLTAVDATASDEGKSQREVMSNNDSNRMVEKVVVNNRVPEEIVNSWTDSLLKDVSAGKAEKGKDGKMYLEYHGSIISLDEKAQKVLRDGVASGVANLGTSRISQNIRLSAMKQAFDLNVGNLGIETSDEASMPESIKLRYQELKGFGGGSPTEQGKVSKGDHIDASEVDSSGLGRTQEKTNTVRQSPDFDKGANF